MKPYTKPQVDHLRELQTQLWRQRFCGLLIVSYSSGLIQQIRKETTKK
jgi:hypothetical protein